MEMAERKELAAGIALTQVTTLAFALSGRHSSLHSQSQSARLAAGRILLAI